MATSFAATQKKAPNARSAAPTSPWEVTVLTQIPSIEELDSLGTAFSVLSRLHLQAPTEETLTTVRDLLDEWPLARFEATETGLKELRASAHAGETAAQISRDHNELYGVTATAKLPPYESVHRENERLIFGQTTLQVRAAYKQLGLTAPRENREPDDHIGLEFDFLARLLLKTLHCVEAENFAGAREALSAAREFLHDHVLQWVPDFLGFGSKLATSHFYRGVMHLSQGALYAITELP